MGIFLALVTALGLASAAGPDDPPPTPETETEAEAVVAFVPPPDLEPQPSQAAPVPSGNEVTRGDIRPGDSLASSFRRAGLPRSIAFRVATLMKPDYDFRKKARPGHTWRVERDAEGELLDFRYEISALEHYHLFFEDRRPIVRREEGELVPRVARIGGVVETSLYDAVRAAGEDPQLARDFAEIFAWDVDFSHAVQAGDEFTILYEQLFRVEEDDDTETYVRPGLILAARYSGAAGDHVAVYFESKKGRGGYYRPDGSSVQGQFLKVPVRHARITSRYSSARRHPILKITRPHHGIDYAAPIGEPVWSVADGKVIYRGWAGGFGNLVKVRHSNGYVSYYSHLSRFARGLRVGSPVRQKQVIGYVGKTGLATGPHVCFRIAKDGRYVNPDRLNSRAGDPIPDNLLGVFANTRDLLVSELDAETLVADVAPR